MMSDTSNQLVIQPKKTEKELSKAQKRFNKLSKELENLQKKIDFRKQNIRYYTLKAEEKLIPLQEQRLDLMEELVKLLDRYAQKPKGFSKKYQEMLVDAIFYYIPNLLSKGRRHLAEIHDRYSEESYTAIEAQEKQAFKDEIEGYLRNLGIKTNINLDDLDLSDPLIVQKFLFRLKDEVQNAAIEDKKPMRKSKKEEKAAQEALQSTQTFQELYRKLAKAYHPDTEKDAARREEKEAVFQQLSQAKEKQDFLGLLKIEMLLAGDEALNEVLDEKLKYYNRMLAEQAEELKSLYAFMAMPVSIQNEALEYVFLAQNEKQAKKRYDELIASLEKDIYLMQIDLEECQHPKGMRAFLDSIEDFLYPPDFPFDINFIRDLLSGQNPGRG